MSYPAGDSPEEKAARYLDLLRSEHAPHPPGTDPSQQVTSSHSDLGDNPAPPRQERRRYARYTCAGSIELRKEWSTVSTWGTFTDISLGGCYVEMQATFPPETKMQVTLELDGLRVHTKAVVRVTYPFLGMGLAFTEISPEDNACLHEMICKLSGPPPSQPVSASQSGNSSKLAADLGLPPITDPVAAIDAIVRHFETKEQLARDDFFELIRRSQSTLPR